MSDKEILSWVLKKREASDNSQNQEKQYNIV